MAFLSNSSITRFLQAVRLVHAHNEGSFHERLFTAAGELFEGTCHSLEIYAHTGEHWAETNVRVPARQMPQYLRRLAELAPRDNPMFAPVAGGHMGPLRMSDFLSLREFMHRDMYHDIFKPVEVRYQLAIPIRTASGLGVVTINRKEKDFTDDEMQLAHLLAPQVGTAFDTGLLIQSIQPKLLSSQQEDYGKLLSLGLSLRECEVLRWIAAGKRDPDIAVILSISVRTVHQHVRSILRKLRVETRTAAVSTAIGNGWVLP